MVWWVRFDIVILTTSGKGSSETTSIFLFLYEKKRLFMPNVFHNTQKRFARMKATVESGIRVEPLFRDDSDAMPMSAE